jgi:ribonuclease Z
VEHCPEASAILLADSASGFSLCYSGDCRPSRRLARAASGVQVFVHEATFADDLSDHAVRKRHSTVAEALAVTREAKAAVTILTHFSQRYPRAVTGAATEWRTDTETPEAFLPITAFDGMRVGWDRLGDLRDTARRVAEMFEAVAAASDAVEGDADDPPERETETADLAVAG